MSQRSLFPEKPMLTLEAPEPWNKDELEEWRCPVCGYCGPLQTFDVLGADDGCVFCNCCNTELEQP